MVTDTPLLVVAVCVGLTFGSRGRDDVSAGTKLEDGLAVERVDFDAVALGFAEPLAEADAPLGCALALGEPDD